MDGQTVSAPHYLVQALMRQISYPDIRGAIRFDKIYFNSLTGFLSFSIAIFNFSRLQNEEDVSFNLRLFGAVFGQPASDPDGKFQYTSNFQQLIYADYAKVLHFGQPAICQDTIIIAKTGKAALENHHVRIVLSFGGKMSPAKTCDYTLHFNKPSDFSDPSSFVISRQENVFLSDLLEKDTPESTIHDFLNEK